MRRVIIESPLAGKTWWHRLQNRAYARRCLKDALMRGEAPLASHLLYTQVLNDHNPNERDWGIAAGLHWLAVADASVVYIDRGISSGMRRGMQAAGYADKPIEFRSLRPESPLNRAPA